MTSLLKWLYNFRAPYVSTTRLVRPTFALNLEEPRNWYCRGRYHPVRIGDVFASRYEVLRKLGWGIYSTVWLAKDSSNDRHIALKICTADAYGYYDKDGVNRPIFELDMLQRIVHTDTTHPGHTHVPRLLDHFVHHGPHGEHICLVFRVMGESLDTFRGRWSPPKMPVAMVQRAAIQVLTALDYLHRSCGIIHTDIKPSNLLTTLPPGEEEAWISKWFSRNPHTIGISYWDYDYVMSEVIDSPATQANELNVQLADIGAASWKDKHLTELIQPPILRAPEVLLRAPWSESVDIWNLAIVIFELLQAAYMFDGYSSASPQYNAADHLAQIVGLFGRIPSELLSQGKNFSQVFDAEGNFLKEPEQTGVTLQKLMSNSNLSEEGKQEFLDFLCTMLKVLPQDRKTAGELLDHPWLRKEYQVPLADPEDSS